jgi:hypothetical protein
MHLIAERQASIQYLAVAAEKSIIDVLSNTPLTITSWSSNTEFVSKTAL